jgi:hypothetical protein
LCTAGLRATSPVRASTAAMSSLVVVFAALPVMATNVVLARARRHAGATRAPIRQRS